MALGLNYLPVSAGDARDAGSISGLGRSLGVEDGSPLQYSCLGSFIDRGAWPATVHVVLRELDVTERAHTHTRRHTHRHTHTALFRVIVWLTEYVFLK